MSEAVLQRSFAAGEVTPSLSARADLVAYQTGLRTCRNFLVRRQGGVANRPGTELVAMARNSGEGRAFLYPFNFAAAGVSTVIEAGDYYFRFHRQGRPLTVASAPAWGGGLTYTPGDLVTHGGELYYSVATTTGVMPPDPAGWYLLHDGVLEVPTPYSAGVWQDPARACWSQQGVILTITHLGHPPRELIFHGSDKWELRLVVFGPTIATPTGLVGAVGVPGVRTYSYLVTAAKAETYEESNPSDPLAIALAGEPTPEAPHLVSWVAVPGATEYYVYSDGSFGNHTYGYLATVTGALTFRDTGFVADFAVTPPIPRVAGLFDAPTRYPALNTLYQQRRVFAGMEADREAVWTSQTGFIYNFAIRSPGQDDDAITFRIAAEEVQVATQLLNVRPMVLLTDRGAWAIEGDESGTLRPVSINPRQHAWSGSAFVRPVVIGDSIIFLQARGNVLRDLRFDQQAQGFRGRDLSLVAAHLFTGHTIDRLTYAEVPDSTVWAVRTDGVLLGLTYIPEEELFGWHRHDTGGPDDAFEDVCTISEGSEDRVYCVVRREVDDTTQRYIERFAQRAEAVVFLDAAIRAPLEPTPADTPTVLSGLAHLNGRQVQVVRAGGQTLGPFTVQGGTVVVPRLPAVRAGETGEVVIGLPYTAQLETLTLDVPKTSVRDQKQLVSSVAFLVEASVRNFTVGPSFDKLSPVRAELWEATTQPDAVSGRVEVQITGTYTHDGHVAIAHTEPTPLTILAALPHLTVGG